MSLLEANRFPAIWLATKELLDLRALLRHRHQWVRLRVKIQNALQAIALEAAIHAVRRKIKKWKVGVEGAPAIACPLCRTTQA